VSPLLVPVPLEVSPPVEPLLVELVTAPVVVSPVTLSEPLLVVVPVVDVVVVGVVVVGVSPELELVPVLALVLVLPLLVAEVSAGPSPQAIVFTTHRATICKLRMAINKQTRAVLSTSAALPRGLSRCGSSTR